MSRALQLVCAAAGLLALLAPTQAAILVGYSGLNCQGSQVGTRVRMWLRHVVSLHCGAGVCPVWPRWRLWLRLCGLCLARPVLKWGCAMRHPLGCCPRVAFHSRVLFRETSACLRPPGRAWPCLKSARSVVASTSSSGAEGRAPQAWPAWPGCCRSLGMLFAVGAPPAVPCLSF